MSPSLNRLSPGALCAAALLAPPLTTLLWGLPLLLDVPVFVLMVLFFSVPFGLVGALLFLGLALAIAEAVGGGRRACAAAGAAAGLVHAVLGGLTPFGQSGLTETAFVIGGFVLAAFAAAEGMFYSWLLAAASIAGGISGLLYARIAEPAGETG